MIPAKIAGIVRNGETGYTHHPLTGAPADDGLLWIAVGPDDPNYEWAKPYGGYLQAIGSLVGRPDVRDALERQARARREGRDLIEEEWAI